MDEVRNEFRSARSLRVTDRTVPINHRRSPRVRVDITVEVRIEPFAHDEVRDAVAIDVGERGSMGFGERNTAGVLRGIVVGDHVHDERDVAGAVALLLEPSQPVAVSAEAGDHVVEPVAVDVINSHACPAGRRRRQL